MENTQNSIQDFITQEQQRVIKDENFNYTIVQAAQAARNMNLQRDNASSIIRDAENVKDSVIYETSTASEEAKRATLKKQRELIAILRRNQGKEAPKPRQLNKEESDIMKIARIEGYMSKRNESYWNNAPIQNVSTRIKEPSSSQNTSYKSISEQFKEHADIVVESIKIKKE